MKYKVTKYAQSCFLIEKDGKRLVLDPGNFVYENNGMNPEDWPAIHVVLVTHQHADHAQKPGLRAILNRDHCPLYSNRSFVAALNAEGIPAKAIRPHEVIEAGGFSIQGVEQKHGDLPPDWKPGPEDIGFVTDGIFYTPGDSVPLKTMPHADVLFVPVIGPQMNFQTAEEMIRIVKPKLVIPMHFANKHKYPIDEAEIRNWRVPGVEILFLEDRQSFFWPEEAAVSL